MCGIIVSAFVRDDGRALVSLYRVGKHANDLERTDRQLLSMDTMLLEMTTLRGDIKLPQSFDTSHMQLLYRIKRIFKRMKPAEPHVQAAFGAHLVALSAQRRLSIDTSGEGNGAPNGHQRSKSRATNGRPHGVHHKHGPHHRRNNGNHTNNNNNEDDSDEDSKDEHAAWRGGACCIRASRRLLRLCCPRLSVADTTLLYPRTRKAMMLANARRAASTASEVAAAMATLGNGSTDLSSPSSSIPNFFRNLTLSPTNAMSSPSNAFQSSIVLRSPHLPKQVDPMITSLHKLEVKVTWKSRRPVSTS
jgi:hypothetical protein